MLLEHKISCDSRCGPGMYLPDIIGSYIFFKTAGDGWQFAKKGVGLVEDAECVMFPHITKMPDRGKRFKVHLRRDQLKTPDVRGDRMWCWHLHPHGISSIIHIRCRDEDVEADGIRDCKVGSVVSWEKSM